MILAVRRYIKPRDYYETIFGKNVLSANQICPFHSDSNPSFKVFDPKDGAYKCHASTCGAAGPHFIAFHTRKYGFSSDEEAAEDIWQNHFRPFEPRERVELLHRELVTNAEMLELFIKERGLTLETIKSEKIGLDIHSGRIVLPMWADKKHCVGFRYWLPRAFREDTGPKSPKIYHDKDAPPLLFNGWRIEEDAFIHRSLRTIYFTGSELDALRMRQDGYLACAGIHGEGKFHGSWANYFTNRAVVICLGSDDEAAAERLKTQLDSMCENASVSIAKWPKAKKGIKDYTDFREAEIISETWLGKFKPEAPATESKSTEPEQVDFSEIGLPKNTHRPIKTRAVICGADWDNYLIPSRFFIKWSTHSEDEKKEKGEIEFALSDPRDYLYFINVKESQWPTILRGKCKIPKTAKMEVNTGDMVDVYPIMLAPDVTGSSKNKYTIHQGFSIGTKPDPNMRYELSTKVVADPKDQSCTVMATELKALGTSNLILSPIEFEQLKYDWGVR